MEFDGGNANDVFDYDAVFNDDPFCAGFKVPFALFYAPYTTYASTVFNISLTEFKNVAGVELVLVLDDPFAAVVLVFVDAVAVLLLVADDVLFAAVIVTTSPVNFKKSTGDCVDVEFYFHPAGTLVVLFVVVDDVVVSVVLEG